MPEQMGQSETSASEFGGARIPKTTALRGDEADSKDRPQSRAALGQSGARASYDGEEFVRLSESDELAWDGEGWYFFRDGSGVMRELDPVVIATLEATLRGQSGGS